MMTQVIVAPGLSNPETISIVKSASTGLPGDAFEFSSEWEAAHFAKAFMNAFSEVVPVGNWTREVAGMSDKDMNRLL